MASKKTQKPGRTWTPTAIFNTAFLAKAWNTRKELSDFEKRGFAQFFYLTVCGYIESLLASKITKRLDSIMLMHAGNATLQKVVQQETTHECSLEPVVVSLRQIILQLKGDVESAPLNRLQDLHARIFPASVKDVIGDELFADLDALATLRNLFAHGRDMFIEFENSSFPLKGTLDGNPLLKPAQRLLMAGIIKDFNITGMNYMTFQSAFYEDAAMLYFYQAVKSIEQKLLGFDSLLPETMLTPKMLTLPDLKP